LAAPTRFGDRFPPKHGPTTTGPPVILVGGPSTGLGRTSTRKAHRVQILQVVLQVLLGVTSLLLTLLILLHKGRGGGLSDMFGGGMTSNLGASGVAERNLNRITVILGLIWIVCIVVLGLITKFSS
jgi:preprotein translocase subunit SecG